MNNIGAIIKSKKTVFTFQEIKKILGIPTDAGVKSFLQRAKANRLLYGHYKGIRTLHNYDPFEFAQIFRPQSYISLETVLFKEGVFFQYYGNTISCASTDSRNYVIDGKTYAFYKIKSDILNNPIGIRNYEHYRIATPERALCDYVYLHPRATIDAPESINKIRLNQILPIYPQKTALYIKKLLDAE